MYEFTLRDGSDLSALCQDGSELQIPQHIGKKSKMIQDVLISAGSEDVFRVIAPPESLENWLHCAYQGRARNQISVMWMPT